METNRITYKLIHQYLEGKLDEKSMHELEKQSLDDPFLAEALEGYSQADSYAGPQLSLLQRQLEERIALQQEKKNTIYFTWQRISVAAAACLLFIAASLLFWMKGSRRQQLLTNTEKSVNVNLTHPDSLQKERQHRPVSPPEVPAASAPVLAERALRPDEPTKYKRNDEQYLAASGDAPRVRPEQEARPTTMPSLSIRIRGLNTVPATDSVPEPPRAGLSGKVVSEDGEPLAGASVMVEGGNMSAVTDGQGNFFLKDSLAKNLRIAYLGYKSKQVSITPGKPVTVTMAEDSNTLSEVAIVGYGAKKLSRDTAEPVDGWKKYNRYLEKKNRLRSGVSGEVLVHFLIDQQGRMSNFVIEKSLGEEADKEAIRLIREGPAWKATGFAECRVTVKFK